jgi:hypothetical protein
MPHFAQVKNGLVVNVIVAEKAFIDTLDMPTEWIQTSYNTKGGIHTAGGVALRGNFAGIGYTYNKTSDVFVPPKPFASWTLNKTTWNWDAPSPMPADGKAYIWDEPTTSWVEATA